MHKLMQVEEPIDIFLSHDWPLGITDCGNWRQLVRFKPHFEREVLTDFNDYCCLARLSISAAICLISPSRWVMYVVENVADSGKKSWKYCCCTAAGEIKTSLLVFSSFAL